MEKLLSYFNKIFTRFLILYDKFKFSTLKNIVYNLTKHLSNLPNDAIAF